MLGAGTTHFLNQRKRDRTMGRLTEGIRNWRSASSKKSSQEGVGHSAKGALRGYCSAQRALQPSCCEPGADTLDRCCPRHEGRVLAAKSGYGKGWGSP